MVKGIGTWVSERKQASAYLEGYKAAAHDAYQQGYEDGQHKAMAELLERAGDRFPHPRVCGCDYCMAIGKILAVKGHLNDEDSKAFLDGLWTGEN